MVEILIIAGVIALGWNRPFEERYDQTKATISSAFDSLGGNLQKNQDPSVRRYEARPAPSARSR
jgi:hypothetical protein